MYGMKPSFFFDFYTEKCPLSDPAHPHHLHPQHDMPIEFPIFHPTIKTSRRFLMCYSCKGKNLDKKNSYYYCSTCKLDFHRGCHLFLPEIAHPFHPSHTLTLLPIDPKLDTSDIPSLLIDYCSPSSFFDGYTDEEVEEEKKKKKKKEEDDHVSLVNGSYHKCKCCEGSLGSKVYYHCSICDFSLNVKCASKPPSLTISNHKSHEHSLTLFPRRISSPCDACGESLEDKEDVVYSCLPCNYMLHSKCVYLPRVIKITRHQHRISHDLSFSPGVFSCGVCRKTVDISYGQYSCEQGCDYVVHSKCATRHDVWDGKDLEGVLEESDEEDVEPFVRIDEETIQHFSHEEHHLKLHKNHSLCNYGENKYCEACCLPVPNSKAFYICIECDFSLDETCAALPRKKNHPLHKHPLTLHLISQKPIDLTSTLRIQGMFYCGGCIKISVGFVYECLEKDCGFQLDVRCASLLDPLIHGCHQQDHPLFLNLTMGEYCMGCKSTECSGDYLECMQCKSFLGIKCATLPSPAHYKHDRHPLTLHYGEKGRTKDEYWCEICESKLDAETWFYTCDLCRVTLHVNCLLEEDIYMKPYHILEVEGEEDIEIESNDRNSRPLCSQCEKRCQKELIFLMGEDEYLCTWSCLLRTLRLKNERKNMLYRRPFSLFAQ